MTLTLTDFLLARIAEDKAVARDFVIEEVENPSIENQRWIRELRRWVTLYDPARAVAECEAKRRIVEEFSPFPTATRQQVYTSRLLFSLLALPHAGHPDYDESWRP